MRKPTLKVLLIAALAAIATCAAAGSASGAPARVPDPVEFEHAAPAAGALTAGASRAGSIVRTGRHFNLVGLRWRGAGASALSVRVHTRGGWGR